jgi:hypothetical protein
VLDVRRWAEIRRMKEVEGLSIHEIVGRTGHDRNTVRRALRREGPPHCQRPPRPSKLDPFKDEITRLLRADPRIGGERVRELLEALGYDGGRTILDVHLREVRPLFERRRTYQRTVYRPGELLQFDLWEPRGEIPVGHGQTRRGVCGDVRAGLVARARRRAGVLEGRREPHQGGALPRPQDAGGVRLHLPTLRQAPVVEHLAQLDVLHARENVVRLGPPGTRHPAPGKTHLAIAVSIRACLAGHRVRFATATEWVARLSEAKRQTRSMPS